MTADALAGSLQPTQQDALDRTRELADDLIRAVAPHHGDLAAINRVLRSWHQLYGSHALGLICAAALQTVFADCLTPIRPEDAEPGAIGLITTERTPL